MAGNGMAPCIAFASRERPSSIEPRRQGTFVAINTLTVRIKTHKLVPLGGHQIVNHRAAGYVSLQYQAGMVGPSPTTGNYYLQTLCHILLHSKQATRLFFFKHMHTYHTCLAANVTSITGRRWACFNRTVTDPLTRMVCKPTKKQTKVYSLVNVILNTKR